MRYKYIQISDDLSAMIKNGKLKKGEKLPSVRKLSEFYGVNKDTIIKALKTLQDNNLIYPVAKSGYFVLSTANEKPPKIVFKSNNYDKNGFPYDSFYKCIDKTISENIEYVFTSKSNPKGLSELVNSLENLLKTYSVYTSTKNLFVTSGAQQALYILSKMKFDNSNDLILIEQPTYHRMNNLVQKLNLPYQTITRSKNGIDLAKLENILQTQNVKFFYTIPRLHNPLGVSYNESQKKAIVQLAEKYNCYIIEDDYMADFDKSASLPLHYYDKSERVIYIKSFSSIIFSPLRIAVVALPTVFSKDFLEYKNLMDYDTNMLLQKSLATYIDSNMYEKHRKKLLNQKNEKHQILKNALANYTNIKHNIYGTSCIFKINGKKDAILIKKMLANSFEIDFLESSYIDSCPYDYIKIDVANMDTEQITPNVAKLLTALETYIVQS